LGKVHGVAVDVGSVADYVVDLGIFLSFGVDKVACPELEPDAVCKHLVDVCVRIEGVFGCFVFGVDDGLYSGCVLPEEVWAQGYGSGGVQGSSFGLCDDRSSNLLQCVSQSRRDEVFEYLPHVEEEGHRQDLSGALLQGRVLKDELCQHYGGAVSGIQPCEVYGGQGCAGEQESDSVQAVREFPEFRSVAAWQQGEAQEPVGCAQKQSVLGDVRGELVI